MRRLPAIQTLANLSTLDKHAPSKNKDAKSKPGSPYD